MGESHSVKVSIQQYHARHSAVDAILLHFKSRCFDFGVYDRAGPCENPRKDEVGSSAIAPMLGRRTDPQEHVILRRSRG